ncbi:MAG: hypothetical protein PHO80_02545 [Candidatus Gracilibacteria bacterium]|nr:hypothetical protein [Candidatus Gracilibacteria bacterium]MDD4530405.1 hypothetical protein [Candidatus Gracilibacteria bacterium]
MYLGDEIQNLKNQIISGNYEIKKNLFILREINDVLIYGQLLSEDEGFFNEKYKEIIDYIDKNNLYKDNFDYLEYKAYFYYLNGKSQRLLTLVNSYRLFNNNELILLLIELLIKDNYDKEDVFEYVNIILDNGIDSIYTFRKLKGLLIGKYEFDLSVFEKEEIILTQEKNKIYDGKNILILCLANSKKYNERCIAGVVIYFDKKSNKIEITNNWIRPISGFGHGEILTSQVENVNMFDILRLENPKYNPLSYQTENYIVDDIKKIKNIEISKNICEHLVYSDKNGIFGNNINKVAISSIKEVNYSLVYIKPENFNIYTKLTSNNNIQLRGVFNYLNIEYDLPITDIDFYNKFNDISIFNGAYKNIYLTISLGVEYKGYHYKLIAGILYF